MPEGMGDEEAGEATAGAAGETAGGDFVSFHLYMYLSWSKDDSFVVAKVKEALFELFEI
jgi:hypothetical protein